MYKYRWAAKKELPLIADYWFKMASEMGELDGIPIPDLQRIDEVRKFFLKENDSGNLMIRIVTDKTENIIACAGGLIRTEYSFPLSEEQTKFGWIIAVYTIEQHRNNGLAHQLVDDVCSWLKDQGATRARLWTSTQARTVYESLGFKKMSDMVKPLT